MRLIDKLYGNTEAETTIVSHFQKSQDNEFDIALDTLNQNFNKGLISSNIYEKALGGLDGLIEKAFNRKYIKREGTPGHYKYWYKESKRTGSHLSVGDIHEHSGGKSHIQDIYIDKETGKKMVDYKHINAQGVHSHETQTMGGYLQSIGKKKGENGKEFEEKKEVTSKEDDKKLVEILSKLSDKQLEKRLDVVQAQMEMIYQQRNQKNPNHIGAYERLKKQEDFIIEERAKRLDEENSKKSKKKESSEDKNKTKEQSKQDNKVSISLADLPNIEKEIKSMSIAQLHAKMDEISNITNSDKISNKDRVDYALTQTRLAKELVNRTKKDLNKKSDKNVDVYKNRVEQINKHSDKILSAKSKDDQLILDKKVLDNTIENPNLKMYASRKQLNEYKKLSGSDGSLEEIKNNSKKQIEIIRDLNDQLYNAKKNEK